MLVEVPHLAPSCPRLHTISGLEPLGMLEESPKHNVQCLN